MDLNVGGMCVTRVFFQNHQYQLCTPRALSCTTEVVQSVLNTPSSDSKPFVLLGSDASCDKAAAALCVGVGKLHEPKETP
eukprot:27724-Amphidinium_carterae.1